MRKLLENGNVSIVFGLDRVQGVFVQRHESGELVDSLAQFFPISVTEYSRENIERLVGQELMDAFYATPLTEDGTILIGYVESDNFCSEIGHKLENYGQLIEFFERIPMENAEIFLNDSESHDQRYYFNNVSNDVTPEVFEASGGLEYLAAHADSDEDEIMCSICNKLYDEEDVNIVDYPDDVCINCEKSYTAKHQNI